MSIELQELLGRSRICREIACKLGKDPTSVSRGVEWNRKFDGRRHGHTKPSTLCSKFKGCEAQVPAHAPAPADPLPAGAAAGEVRGRVCGGRLETGRAGRRRGRTRGLLPAAHGQRRRVRRGGDRGRAADRGPRLSRRVGHRARAARRGRAEARLDQPLGKPQRSPVKTPMERPQNLQQVFQTSAAGCLRAPKTGAGEGQESESLGENALRFLPIAGIPAIGQARRTYIENLH